MQSRNINFQYTKKKMNVLHLFRLIFRWGQICYSIFRIVNVLLEIRKIRIKNKKLLLEVLNKICVRLVFERLEYEMIKNHILNKVWKMVTPCHTETQNDRFVWIMKMREGSNAILKNIRMKIVTSLKYTEVVFHFLSSICSLICCAKI